MTSENTYKNHHRCFVAVDLGAIEHNLDAVKSCIKQGVKTMAVVKANAYGHGNIKVSSFIEDRVDYFAVAGLDEALELRLGGIKKPILVLSYTSPALYSQLIENDITATIYNIEEAKLLSDTAIKMNKKAKVHIALDTGMGRIGFLPDDNSAESILQISRMQGIFLEGLFSHYACADSADKSDANSQTQLFDDFIALLESKGVQIPIKHICNSAASMELDKQYDMCRIGIALYGLYPSQEVDRSRVQLIPAMQVVSHVVHIKDIPEGFKVGYGHIYQAPSPKKIATVSIGYADGYNRCLTGVGYVLINGKKASVVGKVCMDLIMVDITDIEDVKIGDCAVILGTSGSETITAEELGEMSHSFNYEVVCNYMPRMVRTYYYNGKPID